MSSRILLLIVGAALLTSPSLVQAETGYSSTATGVSRLMNPAISLNTLLLGQVSRDVPTRQANQIGLQEAELRFSSVIDPFWTADLIFAVHPEESHDADEEHSGHFALDVETAVAEYQNMPRGFGLKIGKDYFSFGKQVPLHTHTFAFVKAPVGISAFVGEHGLTGTGAELAWNAPLPWWAELKVYGASSSAELFAPESRDLVYGTRLSNLWDTSAASTLEFGLSALTGPGSATEYHHGRWNMYGADLTWKLLPAGTTGGAALNFTNEILLPDPDVKHGDPLGFYSHLEYRFSRQWWFGAGVSVARDAEPGHEHELEDHEEAEHEGEADHDDEMGLRTIRQFKGNLTWTPSEFSSVRMEIYYDEDTNGDYQDLGAYVQVNFTIGSHPAHLY